ncbi:MAG TPA: 4a-hydroxytetrahydrobiopterin dehydratase [Candidatus Binatia bacterium]|nr:4a-hydroxytetrahydrobiopterin dehydratase [Candidatus Binatia bacterium]
MATARLSDDDVRARIAAIAPWELRDGKLHREYRFGSFVDAFGFMASVALVAEAMNHHPEWSNVYGTVRVDLVTHDAGGISERDFRLAERMEAIARSRGIVA